MPRAKKKEEVVSIADPRIKGTILVSGLWASGKTTLAMTLEHPELVFMIDCDQKSKARADSLGIHYEAPTVVSSDPTEYDREEILDWSKEVFNGLPPGMTTLIIDNGSYLEEAFHFAVARDPRRYGVNPGNVASGKYGGTNPGVSKIWKNLLAYVTGNLGYDRVLLTMHMSEQWAGGAPTDKHKVKGNKILTELSNLSLVLVRSTTPNAPPRAVVGKEALGLVTFEDGAFGTYMALPPVIPICTWPEITKLMDEAPAREEFETAMLPTQRERERYSPWMTDEQKELILTIAKNPEFHVTEAEAARFTSDEFVDWPSVIKAAIANKGYKNEAAVRAAMKKVYSQGMGFAKTYDLIPPA